MTDLWVEKYRPSKVAEVVGNKEAVAEFLGWIGGWLKGNPAKKAALLYGPAGVGKTSLVHAYSKENGWEVIEMNASDFRTRENIDRIVGAASVQSSITSPRGKIILIDEVDGIETRVDAGAIQALVKIIEKSRVPIVLTANDPWDPRFSPLREKSLLIRFRRIQKQTIVACLKRIAASEKLNIPEEKIKEIAEKAEGDLRSAINDLQLISSAGEVRLEVGERERKEEVFDALAAVFNAKSYNGAVNVFKNIDLEPSEFFTWILDNAPEQLSPKDLATAMEYLSKADLYLQRISTKQDWHLLRYAIPFMTAGVALAKKSPLGRFVKFNYPTKIRYLSQISSWREVAEGICEKIGKALHMSRRKARTEMLPFIKVIMMSDGEGLADFFGFTDEERRWILQQS